MANRMLGRIDGNTNFAQMDFVVATGVTITAGDFVYFDGDGEITNAAPESADLLVGMATQTVTGNDSTKCSVCIDPMMRYLIDNDNDGTTFSAAQVGNYFQLIGATGAQLIDTSTTSATTGQFVCLEYNPQVDPVKSDTSWGVFVMVNSFLQNYVNVA